MLYLFISLAMGMASQQWLDLLDHNSYLKKDKNLILHEIEVLKTKGLTNYEFFTYDGVLTYQKKLSENLEITHLSSEGDTFHCSQRPNIEIENDDYLIARFYLNESCDVYSLSIYDGRNILHFDKTSQGIFLSTGLDVKNPNLKIAKRIHHHENESFLNTNGEAVKICILDSGFHYNHQGISAMINPKEVGLDLTDNDFLPYASAYDPHGTIVADIASQNLTNVELVLVKLTTSNNGQIGDHVRTHTPENLLKNLEELKQGLSYCKKRGARLVNISLTFGQKYADTLIGKADPVSHEAKRGMIQVLKSFPDLLFIVAAGNEAADLSKALKFPAGLKLDNLITVGAYDFMKDKPWMVKTNFTIKGTNYGKGVDLFADGVEVLAYDYPPTNKALYTGTSMAAPKVTNLAAAILSLRPELNLHQVKKILLKTTSPKNSLLGLSETGGLLNPKAALTKALSY